MNKEIEDKYFSQVAKELIAGIKDEGLWAKAFSLENGKEPETKAHYIRLRVKKISEENPIKLNKTDSRWKINTPDVSDDNINETGSLTSLWARYFAKAIDAQLGVMAGSALVMLSGANLKFGYFFLLSYASMLICLYIFDVILKAKSPGRAIFGIKATPISTESDIYKSRFFEMLTKGNLLFIPFICAVANLISFINARKNGEVSWDKGRFQVTHTGSGWRIFWGILFILILTIAQKIIFEKVFNNHSMAQSVIPEIPVPKGSTQTSRVEAPPSAAQTQRASPNGNIGIYPLQEYTKDNNQAGFHYSLIKNVPLETPPGWRLDTYETILGSMYSISQGDTAVSAMVYPVTKDDFRSQVASYIDSFNTAKNVFPLDQILLSEVQFFEGNGYQQVIFTHSSSIKEIGPSSKSFITNIYSYVPGKSKYVNVIATYYPHDSDHKLRNMCLLVREMQRALDRPLLSNSINQGILAHC